MNASANRAFCSVVLFNCGLSLAQLPVPTPSEVEILKAHNDASKLIIEKAYSVLFNSQVFASRTVGEPGGSTSPCWALTVIVRYDPQAKQRLTDSLALTDQPEQKLYFLAGLLALDPATAKRYPIPAFPAKLRSTAAHTLDGCFYDYGKTFEGCLSSLYAGGTRRYLFDDLPSIYQTIDVSRHEEPKK